MSSAYYENPGPSLQQPPLNFEEYAPSNLQPKTNVELQKLLIDERIRCETHKTNYQTLKEEHKKLQDEFVKVQNDLAKVQDNKVESSEQMQELVRKLQAQLASKTRELEEVRSQALHPHKLEVIKAEITKELEEPLKAHMIVMDKEVEKYRSEYNKLRYEFTFLKAEYDHAKADHARSLDELRLRCQAQVAALQQERDNLLNSQRNTTDVDAQKNLHLQRQKTQLEQRVKNLVEEVSELQKQKEKISIDADSVQRSQARDMTQLRASLKTIESDKRSSDMQCERLQKELRDVSEQVSRLNQQIQNLNKECAALKNQADEESHRHKLALTNQKLESLKLKGELERERDSLVNKTNNLEAEVDILRVSSENHQKTMEEMERDAAKRIQDAREEEWSKNNSLQNEKIVLEEKCRELEQRYEAERSSRMTEREENEEKFRLHEINEVTLNSELSQLKQKLSEEKRIRDKLERDQEESGKLRQRLMEREHELQAMTSLRQQALAEAERSKEVMHDLRKDAENARSQAQRAQGEAERLVESGKLGAMEEKHRLQTRLDQLEHKLKKNAENHQKASKQHKKVKQMLIEKLKQMKKKIELLEAQREQLEIELKAGRHGVSMEEHNNIRRRFRELKRRHNEYRHVIGLGDYTHRIPVDSNAAEFSSFDLLGISRFNNIENKNQDSLNRKEVSLVLKRLDEIAEKQKEQMEALDAVAPPLPHLQSTSAKSDISARRDEFPLPSGADDDKPSRKPSVDSRRSEYEDDFLSTSSA